MKKRFFTVWLDEDVFIRLEKEAKQRRISTALRIRQILFNHYNQKDDENENKATSN